MYRPSPNQLQVIVMDHDDRRTDSGANLLALSSIYSAHLLAITETGHGV